MPFITCTVPSGVVPGDSVGGRGGELFVVGREGPNGVFKILLRVLVSKVQGYAVISFSFEVLYVSCNPAAPI
jgi:hypothetical protein